MCIESGRRSRVSTAHHDILLLSRSRIFPTVLSYARFLGRASRRGHRLLRVRMLELEGRGQQNLLLLLGF